MEVSNALIITAIKIAKPSIQATDRLSAVSAVPVSIAIEKTLATSKILKVKSSSASQSSSIKPLGSISGFLLFKKA